MMRLIAVLTPFFCYLLAKLLNDLYGSNLLAVSVFVGVAFILNWHAFSFLLQSFLESCAPPSKYEAELVGLKKTSPTTKPSLNNSNKPTYPRIRG